MKDVRELMRTDVEVKRGRERPKIDGISVKDMEDE